MTHGRNVDKLDFINKTQCQENYKSHTWKKIFTRIFIFKRKSLLFKYIKNF